MQRGNVPMSSAIKATGRLSSHNIRLASTLMSATRIMSAMRGASDSDAANNYTQTDTQRYRERERERERQTDRHTDIERG